MVNEQKVVVVLPAYNAEKTIGRTYQDIPKEFVDEIILVDDFSNDNTVAEAKKLNIKTFIHKQNLGYGGNQKTCYEQALALGADIVVMLHPDYQYTPKLIPAMAAMISYGNADVVLASRILCGSAIKGGMPLYKYFFNRILTLFENIVLRQKISEYHTGYRAFSAKVLREINFKALSNDFVFDNQILIQIIDKKFKMGEISCPAKYAPESSSINFTRSVQYGLGILYWCFRYKLHQWHILKSKLFD